MFNKTLTNYPLWQCLWCNSHECMDVLLRAYMGWYNSHRFMSRSFTGFIQLLRISPNYFWLIRLQTLYEKRVLMIFRSKSSARCQNGQWQLCGTCCSTTAPEIRIDILDALIEKSWTGLSYEWFMSHLPHPLFEAFHFVHAKQMSRQWAKEDEAFGALW